MHALAFALILEGCNGGGSRWPVGGLAEAAAGGGLFGAASTEAGVELDVDGDEEPLFFPQPSVTPTPHAVAGDDRRLGLDFPPMITVDQGDAFFILAPWRDRLVWTETCDSPPHERLQVRWTRTR